MPSSREWDFSEHIKRLVAWTRAYIQGHTYILYLQLGHLICILDPAYAQGPRYPGTWAISLEWQAHNALLFSCNKICIKSIPCMMPSYARQTKTPSWKSTQWILGQAKFTDDCSELWIGGNWGGVDWPVCAWAMSAMWNVTCYVDARVLPRWSRLSEQTHVFHIAWICM